MHNILKDSPGNYLVKVGVRMFSLSDENQFFRSSRRVKMSFLYEKGRAATLLLLCAYRFKKGNASLDFEQDDYEIRRRRLLPFPFSSPGRQQVPRVTSLRCPKVLI